MTAGTEPIAVHAPIASSPPIVEAHPLVAAPPLVHAAAGTPRAGARLRLYVWQAPVRLTHWVTAGAIVVLSFTGGYIADPFLIPPGGSVMTNVRLIHMTAAIVLIASGLLRAIYLLVGNRYARWSAFFPTTWYQATEVFRQAGFYMFIRREIPRILGHNQLAATAYIALWALLLVETITGFALDGLVGSEPGATLFWLPRELFGPQAIRLVHHLCMWAILAIAVFHVYSSVLVDHLERNGLLSSIFSGYKYVTPEEILEARDGGPAVVEEAEIEEAEIEEAEIEEAEGDEAERVGA
jgi:Ni/Fe-hydrogenase 1 B-type cytochrome subunit